MSSNAKNVTKCRQMAEKSNSPFVPPYNVVDTLDQKLRKSYISLSHSLVMFCA